MYTDELLLPPTPTTHSMTHSGLFSMRQVAAGHETENEAGLPYFTVCRDCIDALPPRHECTYAHSLTLALPREQRCPFSNLYSVVWMYHKYYMTAFFPAVMFCHERKLICYLSIFTLYHECMHALSPIYTLCHECKNSFSKLFVSRVCKKSFSKLSMSLVHKNSFPNSLCHGCITALSSNCGTGV